MKTEQVAQAMKNSMLVIGMAFATALVGGCGPWGDTKVDKLQTVNNMASDTLQEAYRREPELKGMVERAEGYAVFKNFGTQLTIFATGSGYGLVRDNRTGDETHMKMLQLGGGIGLAIKDYRAVFVFHTRSAMRDFIEHGWGAEGQAQASARAGEEGGAAGAAGQIAGGVSVYQFTKNGLALQATISGMKFWKNDELN